GSVTKVWGRHADRVQTGMLSINSPEGDVVGLDALTFSGGRLFGVVTGACGVTGLPERVSAQLGKVLPLRGVRVCTVVGDASTIECTAAREGQGQDTDPYGLAARGSTFFVADAAGNVVVKIRNGRTSVATVLSRTGQPVPTSLAFGPDGALYI